MIKKFILSPLFFLVVSLILMETIVSVLPQQIFGMLIDNLTRIQNSGRYIIGPFVQYLAEHTVVRDFSLLLVLYFLIAILSLGLSIARGYFVTFFGEKVIKDIRQRLFSGLLRAKPSYLNQITSGEMSVQMMSDVEGIRNLLISPVNGILVDVITALLMVIICFRISPILTLALLIPTPLIIFSGFYFGNKQIILSRKLKQSMSELTTTVINRLKGFMLFKVFAQEKHEDASYSGLLTQYYSTALKSLKVTLGLFPITSGVHLIVSVSILAIGSQQVDKQQISIGELIIFIQYLGKIYNPLINVSRFYNSVAMSIVSYKRVQNSLANIQQNQELQVINSSILNEMKGSCLLRFEDVGFTYNLTINDNWLIPNLNLSVMNGEKVSIVGASGSGKTTILNLITKLILPDTGKILYKGIDLNQISTDSLRKEIGYLTQNTILYNIPLIDNIRYGNQTATESDVIASLKQVNLEHLTKPEMLHRIMGENGELLSGGERQRISVARLILCDPSLILLDEPIASLDDTNARRVLDMIFSIFNDKSIIVTSHQQLTLTYTSKTINLL